MYNLIEYRDNFSKTLGILWLLIEIIRLYDVLIVSLADNNTTNSFEFKEKITAQTGMNNTS